MFFRFQDPPFLTLVFLIILAVWLRRFWGKQSSISFSSNWAINKIVRNRFSFFRRIGLWLRLSTLILIVLALMRPQNGKKWTEQVTEGVDIMLAIDLSNSMHAHDFELDGRLVSRLEVVKDVVSGFIESRKNDRIGLIIFAEEPFLVSPLTNNRNWLKSNLNRLEIGLIEPNSTAIGSAIGLGLNRLRSIDGESKVLILLTDGENNAGKLPPIAAAEAARTLGCTVYTIGVGNSGSVMMPRVRDGAYILNENGNPIMDWTESNIDEQTLREIAQLSSGNYFRATNTENLKKIYEEIDQLEKKEISFVRFDEVNELMIFPIFAALALLLLEIFLNRTYLHKIP